MGLGTLAIVGTKGRLHKHPEGSSPVLVSKTTSYSTSLLELSIELGAFPYTLWGSFGVESLPADVVSFLGFQHPLFFLKDFF